MCCFEFGRSNLYMEWFDFLVCFFNHSPFSNLLVSNESQAWSVCDSILLSLCHEGSGSRCLISNLLKYSWRPCMTCRYLSVWCSVSSAKQVLLSRSLPWLYKELKESHWLLAPHFLQRKLLEKYVNYARNCHLCGQICSGHIYFAADNFWWLWQMRCKFPGQDPAVKLLVHGDMFCFDAWI